MWKQEPVDSKSPAVPELQTPGKISSEQRGMSSRELCEGCSRMPQKGRRAVCHGNVALEASGFQPRTMQMGGHQARLLGELFSKYHITTL